MTGYSRPLNRTHGKVKRAGGTPALRKCSGDFCGAKLWISFAAAAIELLPGLADLLLGFAGGKLATEPFDTAGCIYELLLAGEERVAGGADFENNIALVGGARLEVVSAGAANVDLLVLGVNAFLWHGESFRS